MCLGGANPFRIIDDVAGNLIGGFGDNQTKNKQNYALGLDNEHLQALQRRISDAINQRLTTLAGSSTAPYQLAATGDYLGAIRDALPAVAGFSGGRYSDRYRRAAQDSTGKAMADSGQIAHLMGALDAPVDLRRNEGYGTADLAQKIGMLADFAHGQHGADDIYLSTIHSNPWLSMSSKALRSYGSAKAFGSAKGG